MPAEQKTRQQKVRRLLFIYDVKLSKMGTFLNAARRVLMIGGCALHAMTHGILNEKDAWKACQAELGIPIDYYHCDDIPEAIKEQIAGNLPCIVAQTDLGYVMLLSPAVVRRCRGDFGDLKGRIHYYLAANNLTI